MCVCMCVCMCVYRPHRKSHICRAFFKKERNTGDMYYNTISA